MNVATAGSDLEGQQNQEQMVLEAGSADVDLEIEGIEEIST